MYTVFMSETEDQSKNSTVSGEFTPEAKAVPPAGKVAFNCFLGLSRDNLVDYLEKR